MRVVERPAVDHVEVGQAVVVVVEPDAARAGAFEQRTQLARAKAVREVDAGLVGRIFKSNGSGRRGGRWCRGLRDEHGGKQEEKNRAGVHQLAPLVLPGRAPWPWKL